MVAIYERTPVRYAVSHVMRYKNVAYEDDLAHRWWALPPGSLLPTSDGSTYCLLFAGRHGGSAGPDVRDAVLQGQDTPTERRVGDIEFHTRASDWVTHQHHSDPRYNQVMLHVVLYCDTLQPTRRQDGYIIPVCSLNDLPSSSFSTPSRMQWPCQRIMNELSEEERRQRLHRAGMLRFEQKTSVFIEQLHAAMVVPFMEATIQTYTTYLLIALAEALGYGRDRALFRAIGLYLVGQTTVLPEPLGHSLEPAPIDSQRLAFLRRIVQAWQPPEHGGWQQIRAAIQHCELGRLRALFCEQGLSLARADILLCNVVLPFAAAIALLERDMGLQQHATSVYLAHPGLPSNAITRMMCQHMGLMHEPQGACQQQGLHHIYQETCREKQCMTCIAGREKL